MVPRPEPLEEENPVKDKSVGAALVLTFLFGPLGIFYVSILWAVVFIVPAIVVAVLTLGLGLLLVWPASMILAAAMASNQHSRFQAWLAGGRS
jgi:energy-coupling factor transporter transmembrane protein EcfT